MQAAARAHQCALQAPKNDTSLAQTATAVVVTLQPEAGASTTGSRAQIVAVVSGPAGGDPPTGSVQFTATPTIGGEHAGPF